MQVDKFKKIRKATKIKIRLPLTDGYVEANKEYITADFDPFSECDTKIIEKTKTYIAKLTAYNNETEPAVTELIANLQELLARVEDWQYSSLVKTKEGIYRYIFQDQKQVDAFLEKYTPKN